MPSFVFLDEAIWLCAFRLDFLVALDVIFKEHVLGLLSEGQGKFLTVTEYVECTNQMLDPYVVLVTGEICSFNNRNPHAFFSIKDESHSLDCYFFGVNKLDFVPELGMKVELAGKGCIFKNGKYNLKVQEMAPSGEGKLIEDLKRLEAQLEKEGVFDIARRPLPAMPKHVAFITSANGAVMRDIIRITSERNPLLEITVIDAQVQGFSAPISLVEALDFAYRNYANLGIDVLIIGRGGGSFEDLLAFSDERVVRKIAQSPIPIISAVGHETDSPISDRAADIRASTPSKAAADVTPITTADLRARVDNLMAGLEYFLNKKFNEVAQNIYQSVTQLSNRYDLIAQSFLAKQFKRITDCENKIANQSVEARVKDYHARLLPLINAVEALPNCIGEKAELVQKHEERMLNAVFATLKEMHAKLERLSEHLDRNFKESADSRLHSYRLRFQNALTKLETNNPIYQLQRGLTITTTQDNKVINPEAIKQGDVIYTHTEDRIITSVVTESKIVDNETRWNIPN